MKKVLVIVFVLALLGVGYWYATKAGWFTSTGPDNLPTAAERKRMEEIERSSATIAPDALPGIQVREPGSTPPPPPVAVTEDTASTTDSTSTPSVE